MSNIVFVGAHNDDAEIFAGGTLLSHIDNKDYVYLLIFDGLNDTRKNEQYNADKESSFITYYFRDKNELENKLFDICPDILITHWDKDTHPHHKNISKMALDAVKNIKIKFNKPNKIYFCNSHNGFGLYGEFSPNKYINIDKYFFKKRKILKKFISENPEFWIKKAEAITKRYGNRCNVGHAEGFIEIFYLGGINSEKNL